MTNEYETIEDSPHFKVGYLRGMANTALYYLRNGRAEEAKRHIEDGLRTLKMPILGPLDSHSDQSIEAQQDAEYVAPDGSV